MRNEECGTRLPTTSESLPPPTPPSRRRGFLRFSFPEGGDSSYSPLSFLAISLPPPYGGGG